MEKSDREETRGAGRNGQSGALWPVYTLTIFASVNGPLQIF